MNDTSSPEVRKQVLISFAQRPTLLTEDAVLAEELLARKKLGQEVAGRLADRALLVRPGRVETVVDELRKMGHTPQVVGRLG